MPLIGLQYDPPSHGWLTLCLTAGDKTIEIDASDVPNNPLQELIAALEAAASGAESSVWWHLEPDGYFMNFKPMGSEIQFSLEFATRSERHLSESIVSVSGSKAEVLLPFWRFLRDFQSRTYQEPNWPILDFSRMQVIKAGIGAASEA
jgi:hypothetical protein